jgi:hypothetical protein
MKEERDTCRAQRKEIEDDDKMKYAKQYFDRVFKHEVR